MAKEIEQILNEKIQKISKPQSKASARDEIPLPLPYFNSLPPIEAPLKTQINYSLSLKIEHREQIGNLSNQLKGKISEKKEAPPSFIPSLHQLLDHKREGQSSLTSAMKAHLIKDLENFQQRETQEIQYLFDSREMIELIDANRKEAMDFAGRSEFLKKNILKIANHLPSQEVHRKQYEVLRSRGKLIPFELNELIINFAVQRPEDLQKRNPALSPQDLEHLYSDLAEYLLLATHQQKEARIREALKKLEIAENKMPRNEEAIIILKQRVATFCLDERAYLPNSEQKHTCAYLVFEYFGDLLLRPSQVGALKDFLDEGNVNLIKEMIMGSGKTHVLMRLLAVLRAVKGKISTLIVHPSYYKDVVNEIYRELYQTFGQTLKTIHFDRQTPLTVGSLNTLLNELRMIQQEGDALIMSSSSKHCLLLRFLEVCFENPGSAEAEGMLKILRFLMAHGVFLYDEVDSILNALQTTSFGIGKKTSVESFHLAAIHCLYQILYFDPEIGSLISLDSDPKRSLDKPLLTEELYAQKIKHLLAQKFLQRLIQDNQLSLEKVQKTALFDYLCADPKLTKERREKAEQELQKLPQL